MHSALLYLLGSRRTICGLTGGWDSPSEPPVIQVFKKRCLVLSLTVHLTCCPNTILFQPPIITVEVSYV